MSPSFRTFACVVALALCLGGRVEADFNLNVSVDGIQLGKHLLGPERKSEDLKNRVVLLEFWGVNCPPCLASMPKLAAWNFELQSLGLVVIGAHAQGGPAQAARALAQKPSKPQTRTSHHPLSWIVVTHSPRNPTFPAGTRINPPTPAVRPMAIHCTPCPQ